MNTKYGLCALLLFVSLTSSAFDGINKCERYQQSSSKIDQLKKLAKKLYYTQDELCLHERIQDIQFEKERRFYQDVQAYESLSLITLHYSDYSCLYIYNLQRKQWLDKENYCYSTL